MNLTKREPIRVLVADGDPLICRALTRLLGRSADIEVIGAAIDEAEVLVLTGQLRPAVVVMDAHTTRLDGMSVTRRLSLRFPGTQVIILGVYATMREEALGAGARQFLLKDCPGEELVGAVRLAGSGAEAPGGIAAQPAASTLAEQQQE